MWRAPLAALAMAVAVVLPALPAHAASPDGQAETVVAAVDLLVGEARSIARTLQATDTDPLERLNVALVALPPIETRLRVVERDLALTASELADEGWAVLLRRVQNLARTLSSLRGTATATDVPRLADALGDSTQLVVDARDDLTDRWTRDAAAPLVDATIVLLVVAAGVCVLSLAFIGSSPWRRARRRAVLLLAAAILLAACGTAGAAGVHVLVVRARTLGLVSVLPVPVFVIISLVPLGEAVQLLRSTRRAARAAPPAPLPTMRVDDSSGMLMWGEKLEALEQIRRPADGRSPTGPPRR